MLRGGSDLIPRRDILIPRFVFRGPIAGVVRQPPFACVR
jgi:hypothetical protein